MASYHFISTVLGGVTLSWSSRRKLLTMACATQLFTTFSVIPLILLYAKLVLLQYVFEVFQISLLVRKLLNYFCFRDVTFIMCCEHFVIKLHTPLQSFPDPNN